MNTALLLVQNIQVVKASTRDQLTQGLLVPMEIPPLHHGMCFISNAWFSSRKLLRQSENCL